jgi:DNA-binding NtrC family response regulator
MRQRLLIVDDDAAIRDSLAEALGDASTEVVTAESAERALTLVGGDGIDVVLTDVRMAGLDGVELLRLLRERAPDIDVVLMTAYDDMSTVVAAMRAGAVEFLVKPLDLHELRRVLTRVFEDRITRSRADRRPIDALRRLPEGHPEPVGRDRESSPYKLTGRQPRRQHGPRSRRIGTGRAPHCAR